MSVYNGGQQGAQEMPYTNSSYIAKVDQGCFGTAEGTRGNAAYIGTVGLGPCVGVAFISKTEGKHPLITVAHFDSQNAVRSSLSLMFEKHPNGVDIAYVESGESEKQLKEIIDEIEAKGITPQVNQTELESLGRTGWVCRNMIFDLATGEPVDPKSLGFIQWNLVGNKDERIVPAPRPLFEQFTPDEIIFKPQTHKRHGPVRRILSRLGFSTQRL